MIPNTEAIMEEEGPENQTRIGGMFKRNSNMNEEDENYDKLPLRKTTTDYIYESNGQNNSKGTISTNNFNRQDSIGQRIMSG